MLMGPATSAALGSSKENWTEVDTSTDFNRKSRNRSVTALLECSIFAGRTPGASSRVPKMSLEFDDIVFHLLG